MIGGAGLWLGLLVMGIWGGVVVAIIMWAELSRRKTLSNRFPVVGDGARNSERSGR